VTILYRPFTFKGTMHFSPLSLEKPMNTLELNLTGVITSIRSINSPNLVQISREVAPSRGGEIKRFCNFLLQPFFFFFRFLIQPTGRNFGPFCTLSGSKDVFQLIHYLFRVWYLQIHYQESSSPKNCQI